MIAAQHIKSNQSAHEKARMSQYVHVRVICGLQHASHASSQRSPPTNASTAPVVAHLPKASPSTFRWNVEVYKSFLPRSRLVFRCCFRQVQDHRSHLYTRLRALIRAVACYIPRCFSLDEVVCRREHVKGRRRGSTSSTFDSSHLYCLLQLPYFFSSCLPAATSLLFSHQGRSSAWFDDSIPSCVTLDIGARGDWLTRPYQTPVTVYQHYHRT